MVFHDGVAKAYAFATVLTQINEPNRSGVTLANVGDDRTGTILVAHPDITHLKVRSQALEQEISHSADEAAMRDLKLRKLYLEDELELLRQHYLNLARMH